MEKKKTPGVCPECPRRKRKSSFDIKTFLESDMQDDEAVSRSKRKRAKKSAKISSTEANCKMGKRVLKKGESSLMCHQCQRNDKGRVVHCTRCITKRFCVPCMKHWYPLLSEQEIAEKCPVCRKNCNCKGCLRKNGMTLLPEMMLSREDEVKYGWWIVRYLYPWLKEFNYGQNAEKVIEARIIGLDERELELPQVKCETDERMYCGKCQTSIVDFHRTCCNCGYTLCLACSHELREHHSHTASGMEVPVEEPVVGGDKEMPSNKQIVLFGKEAVLGGEEAVSGGTDWVLGGEEVLSSIRPDVWTPWADGQIPCPPERLGGCNSSVLELHSVLGENFISQLFRKITEMASRNPNIKNDEVISNCECSTEFGELNSRKASNRKNTGDNCVYCPLGEVAKEQLGHFQKHWMKGEPVVVRDVLELTSGLSWEPMVMWRALRETKYKDQEERLAVTAVDCRDWTHTEVNTHHFFTGYMNGLSHKDNWPFLLKVKDWPPESSVCERLPRHGVEFLAALPFKEYTDPRCGPLNLAVKLREKLLKSDLGLKMDIAYGIREELVEGNSVTKLHCEMADAISILTHTSEVKLTAYQRKAIEKKHNNSKSDIKDCKTNDTFKQEEKSNIIGKKINTETNINPDDSDSKEYGGALWDIWRREDVPKLIEYLKKHSREFTYYENKPVEQVAHPIHDQSFYLTMDHKRKLKEEFGIEAWTFEQKRGEAVLIPAGCPHQVRNLKSCIKVALDFVSPENFSQCIELSNQFRLLPEGHRAKKDKLEVKKMAIYALKKAVAVIEGINSDRGDKYHDGQSWMTKRKRRQNRKRWKESGKEKPTEYTEQADDELKEEIEAGNSYKLEKHSKEQEMIKPKRGGRLEKARDFDVEETVELIEVLPVKRKRGRPQRARLQEPWRRKEEKIIEGNSQGQKNSAEKSNLLFL